MISDSDFEVLKVKINQILGIDLGYYKPQQMQRRLSGHLTRLHLDAREFCGLIGNDPEAARELREFITINVSEFFRDPAQFDVLKS
ncbi:MAG: chemotaxis protein CheR, partial [Chloroflexi bacterium]|nr:chemotaxis protein CheR [Chloroflexota bacterium]